MTAHTTHPRSSFATRRFGYAVAITVNLVILALVNTSPGWQAVGILTPRVPEVLGWVNASLLAAVVANAAYSLHDPAWFRALGDAVTTVVGGAAMVRIWQVFPFEFDTSTVPWDLVVRWVIGVGIAGSLIGVVVAVVKLVRALATR
jgi:hypothetical protein